MQPTKTLSARLTKQNECLHKRKQRLNPHRQTNRFRKPLTNKPKQLYIKEDNKSPREKTRANKQQDINPAKLLHVAFEAKHRGEDIDVMDHKGTRTERLI